MGKFSSFFRSPAGKSDDDEKPPPYSDSSATNAEKSDVKDNGDFQKNQATSSQQAVNQPPPAPAPPPEPEVIITFVVGPEAKEYQLPKSKICAESRVVRHLLSPGQPGAETNRVVLDQQKPRPFDLIVTWLNTERLPDLWYENLAGSMPAAESSTVLFKAAIDLQMYELANFIIDEIKPLFAQKQWTIAPSQIWKMREMGMEHTQIFNFYLSILVHDLMRQPKVWLVDEPIRAAEIEKMFENQALTTIVMKRVLKWHLQTWIDPRIDVGCPYHDHSDGCKRYYKSIAQRAPKFNPGGAGAASANMNQQVAMNSAIASLNQQQAATTSAAAVMYSNASMS